MPEIRKQPDQIRNDLPLLNRLGIVTAVALISAATGSSAALISLVLLHVAWPMSVLAPMRWRNEITERAYLRGSSWFLPGLITVVGAAYGASQGENFPVTALVVGIGACHFLVVGAIAVKERPYRWWAMALGGCIGGIAGSIADWPEGLGWNFLAMAVYGVVGIAAVAAVRDGISFRAS